MSGLGVGYKNFLFCCGSFQYERSGVNVAKPIIDAKIGVEQGLAANANSAPIKNG